MTDITLKKKYFNKKNVKKILNKFVVKFDTDLYKEKKIVKAIKSFNADICVLFGVPIINENLIKILPHNTLNIHMGLSQFYRGTANFFWPFYFLEPNCAGITIHKVNKEIDSGDILCQVVPRLEYGDKIHDISCKSIIKATDVLKTFIKNKPIKNWKYTKLTKKGKLFLSKDFKPQHLRVIYNQFNNKIVDLFLDKKITSKKIKIISKI